MALQPFQKTAIRFTSLPGGWRIEFVIFPVPLHVFPGSFRRIVGACLLSPPKVCGGNQSPILSQHGEHRKGAMGILSSRRDKTIQFQFALRLTLDGRQDIRYQYTVLIAGRTGVSAQIGHRLEVDAPDSRDPFFGELDDSS